MTQIALQLRQELFFLVFGLLFRYAAGPLQQTRIQVVRSYKVARKRLTEWTRNDARAFLTSVTKFTDLNCISFPPKTDGLWRLNASERITGRRRARATTGWRIYWYIVFAANGRICIKNSRRCRHNTHRFWGMLWANLRYSTRNEHKNKQHTQTHTQKNKHTHTRTQSWTHTSSHTQTWNRSFEIRRRFCVRTYWTGLTTSQLAGSKMMSQQSYAFWLMLPTLLPKRWSVKCSLSSGVFIAASIAHVRQRVERASKRARARDNGGLSEERKRAR